MFVQRAAVQKETFLITIALWEGLIAQSGEYSGCFLDAGFLQGVG